ncbi:MAG: glycosyltransferase family 4 protein [Bdellovibrio sp.]
MSKLLWVLPRVLFPIKDGASTANKALISPLAKTVETLDLICFGQIENKDRILYDEIGVGQIFELEKKKVETKWQKFKSFLSNLIDDVSLPLTAGSFISSKNDTKVKMVLQNKYDSIIFDGLHPFILFRNFNLANKIVYRAHNVEQDLWAGAMERSNNLFIKFLLKWQGEKMGRLENELCRRADSIWAISPEDRHRFIELGFKDKVVLINCGMNFQKIDFERPLREPKQLLFLGKLDWAPNRDGLVWFLENVWCEFKLSDLHLHIVGSGHFDRMDLLGKYSNITLHGFVPDLAPLFEKCDASIVPIHYGSGTRIKVIDCVSRGMPLISTGMGVQGSGLEIGDFVEANNRDQWIQALSQLDSRHLRKTSKKAYERLFALYDLNQQARKAYQTML